MEHDHDSFDDPPLDSTRPTMFQSDEKVWHSPSKHVNKSQHRIEQDIEKLHSELKSKQRLVIGLNSSLKPVDNKLAQEIYNRDRFIEELNNKLLDHNAQKFEIKRKRLQEKDQVIEKLESENARLNNEKMVLSDQIAEQQLQANQREQEFLIEIENHEAEKEQLRQDFQEFENEKHAQDLKTKEVQNDVIKLALVVQGVTGMNSNMANQIADLQKQIEQQQTELFSYKVKASSAELIEQQLADQMTDFYQLEREHKKSQKLIDHLKSDKNALIDCYDQNADKIKKIEAVLYESIIEEVKAVSEELTEIRHDLKNKFKALSQEKTMDDIDEETLEFRYDEMVALKNADLVAKDVQISKLNGSYEVVHERIKELETLLEKHDEQILEAEDRSNQKSQIIDEFNEKLKAQLHKANSKIIEQQQELSKAQSLNMVSKDIQQGQQDLLHERIKLLEHELAEYKHKLHGINNQVKIKQNEFTARENRISKIVAVVKSYEDELFARDTKLIQKTGKVEQLEKENEALRKKLNHLKVTVKQQTTRQQEIAAQKISEKEHESQMLKDMLHMQKKEWQMASQSSSPTKRHKVEHRRPPPENKQPNTPRHRRLREKEQTSTPQLRSDLRESPMFERSHKPTQIKTGNITRSVSPITSPTALKSDQATPKVKPLRKNESMPIIGAKKPVQKTNPLYQLINNFLTRIDDVREWRIQKAKRFSDINRFRIPMPIKDLRLMLDADIPGRADMWPHDALEKVYKVKIAELRKEMVKSLKGIKQRIDVQELLKNVRKSKLNEILYERREVSIIDLCMALQEIG